MGSLNNILFNLSFGKLPNLIVAFKMFLIVNNLFYISCVNKKWRISYGLIYHFLLTLLIIVYQFYKTSTAHLYCIISEAKIRPIFKIRPFSESEFSAEIRNGLTFVIS